MASVNLGIPVARAARGKKRIIGCCDAFAARIVAQRDDESTDRRRSFTAPGDRRVPSAAFVNWPIITVKSRSTTGPARYRNDARGENTAYSKCLAYLRTTNISTSNCVLLLSFLLFRVYSCARRFPASLCSA